VTAPASAQPQWCDSIDPAELTVVVVRDLAARLRNAVSGAPENAAFAVTSLSEAAEEIVEAAHADIEARLIDMASALPEGSLPPMIASEMLTLPESEHADQE